MTTSYTDFTCRSGGSNLASGSLVGSGEEPIAPTVNYTGVTIGGVAGLGAGTWTNSTNVFLPPTGRNPVTDGLAIGQFVSLFTAGSTSSAYIARITGVTNAANGAITLSAGVAAGTKPAGTGAAMSLVAGGAWAGPNTTDQAFPLALANLGTLDTVTTGFPARINFKDDQTYTVSAVTTCPSNAALTLQGYHTTFADGLGRPTLTGGTSGASFNLLAFSGANAPDVRDFIFKNNGATGAAHGISAGTSRQYYRNCIFTGMLGAGLNCTGNNAVILEECEVYGNNTSGTASQAGILVTTTPLVLLRCFIHDNTGSNTSGVQATAATAIISLVNCVISGNTSHGFAFAGPGSVFVFGCDFYNNGGSAFMITNTSAFTYALIENSNFLKNTLWAINFNTFTAGATNRYGSIVNCGFGVGTQANGSGDINTASDGIGNMQEIGSVNYGTGLTPWNDPVNGDFTVTLATAKAAGRGTFVETSASLSAPNTLGRPDIGAAQHLDSGGGAGGLIHNPGMRGGML